MSEQTMDSLQHVIDSILHFYGWSLEVKEGTDEEIIVEYKQGVDDLGLPGGIFRILLSEFETRGLSLTRISIEDQESLYLVFREI
ncbi:MAG: hypothetical protein M1427_06610 [Candidatus Thermoplasmatota archaeon]|jgi:hypothetical protein|nr:hypothetical protein [Candidatus Thermoplasmatota archaeon]